MLKSKWAACAFGIFVTMSLMTAGSAIAANSCSDPQDEGTKLTEKFAALKAVIGMHRARRPVACSSINLRTAQLHVKCRTSNGSIYERVSHDNFGEAWKGPDGVIWSDFIGSDTQYNAVNMCKKIGGELPSVHDFAYGEAKDFREVLPNINDRWFWSSENNPHFSDGAYVFVGDFGQIEGEFRNSTLSVRCVAR